MSVCNMLSRHRVLLSCFISLLLCSVVGSELKNHYDEEGDHQPSFIEDDLEFVTHQPQPQVWATLTESLHDEFERVPMTEDEAMSMLLELHESMDVASILEHQHHQELFESKPTSSAAPAPSSKSASSAAPSKKRTSKRKPASDRLSPTAHAEKFSRFTKLHSRKYATPTAAAEAFATFKANRQTIVALNDKADPEGVSPTLFKSTGPLADIPKSKFTRTHTNAKNPRGNTRGKSVKIKRRAKVVPKDLPPADKAKIGAGKSAGAAGGSGQAGGKGAEKSGKVGGASGHGGKEAGGGGQKSGKVGGQSGESGKASGRGGKEAGAGGQKSGKIGGESGRGGKVAGADGRKSGKIGGETGHTSKKSGKIGGETGHTSKKSGKIGGETGHDSKKSGKIGGTKRERAKELKRKREAERLALSKATYNADAQAVKNNKFGARSDYKYQSLYASLQPTLVSEKHKVNTRRGNTPLNADFSKQNIKYANPSPIVNGNLVTHAQDFRHRGVNMTSKSKIDTSRTKIGEIVDFSPSYARGWGANESTSKANMEGSNVGIQTYHDGVLQYNREMSRRSLMRYGGLGSQDLSQFFDVELKRDVYITTPPPQNQPGECGSCWAFVAKDAMEFLYIHLTGPARNFKFSAQQIIDCVRTEDSKGCAGGSPMDAIDWWYDNLIALASEYPATGTEGKCKKGPLKGGMWREGQMGTFLASYGWQMLLPPCSEQVGTCMSQIPYEIDLLRYLNAKTTQPIIYVDATNFQHYHGGVFNPALCQSTMEAGNHIMQISGYAYDKVYGPVWILRNSWGKKWGEAGFMRLPFGMNACGVMNYVIQTINPANDDVNLRNAAGERHLTASQIVTRLKATAKDYQTKMGVTVTADQMAEAIGKIGGSKAAQLDVVNDSKKFHDVLTTVGGKAEAMPARTATKNFNPIRDATSREVVGIGGKGSVDAPTWTVKQSGTINFSAIPERTGNDVYRPYTMPTPATKKSAAPAAPVEPAAQPASSEPQSLTAAQMYAKLVAQGLIKPKPAPTQ